MAKKPSSIKKDIDVPKNADPHIDQDFPGFPHPPSDKKKISPKTETEKKLAGADKKHKKKTYG
jgi:hypothetical protein